MGLFCFVFSSLLLFYFCLVFACLFVCFGCLDSLGDWSAREEERRYRVHIFFTFIHSM